MKKKSMVLSVIIFLSLIMLVTSTALAYFVFNYGGESSSSTVQTARLGKVEYVVSSPEASENVFPGWKGEGSTRVYFISDSDVAVDYTCTLTMEENSYTNNVYVQTIDGTDGNLLSETPVPSTPGEEIILSKGTLEPEKNIISKGQIHEVKYNIIFKETGTEQNIDQGKIIKTHVTCFLDKTEYEENKRIVTLNVEGATPDAEAKYVHVGGSETFTLTPEDGYDIDSAEVISEEELESRNKSKPLALNTRKYTINALKLLVDDEEEELEEDEPLEEENNHCKLYIDEENNLKVLATNIEKNTVCNIKLDKEKYYFYFTSDEAQAGFESLFEVEYGQEVNRIIEPKEGYILEGATTEGYEGCTVSGNLVSAYITKNGRCKVTLNQEFFSVNVNITGANPSTITESDQAYGQDLTYTLIPEEGYTTQGAYYNGGGCLLEEDILKVHVTKNVSYNISLPKIPPEPKPKHTVTVLCSNCTSNFGQKSVYEGSNATFAITATSGFTLRNADVTSSNETNCILNENNELTVKNVVEDTTCTVIAKTKSHVLSEKILDDNKSISAASIDYNKVDKNNNTGEIYYTTDTQDKSRVYFYRGNVTNNWVIFGKNNEGKELYWRIIRTNSNNEGNGVRLLYVGPNPSTTNASIASSNFNDKIYPSAIRYMYGSSYSDLDELRTNIYDSDVKLMIDNYYSRNLVRYSNYINRNAIYCGDSSIYNGTYTIKDNGKIKTTVYTNAYKRAYKIDEPSYACEELSDRYSTKNGNESLKYPIALMTIDEIVFAGGSSGKGNSKAWYYLNSIGSSIMGNQRWWTMSPAKIASTTSSTAKAVGYIYEVNGRSGTYGSFQAMTVDKNYAIRPVISLNNDVLTNDADGTVDNPYRILPYENVKVNVICENCKESEVSFEVEKHSDKVLTINPKEGYMIRHSTVSGEGCKLKGNALSIENAYNNQTCTVTLSPLAYEIRFIVDHGSAAPSYVEVAPGETTVSTVTASTGYDINTLTTTSSGCKAENGKITAYNVGKDRSCVASMNKLKYTVNLSVTNGTTSSNSQIVEYGSNASFTITANENYDISKATVTGGCTISGSTVTASNVTSNVSCNVNIPIKQYTVSVSCTGCSSNPSSALINHSSNATFTLTASNNYKLSGSTVTGTGCSLSGSTLTVRNVTNNVTCTVKAVKSSCTVTRTAYSGSGNKWYWTASYECNGTTGTIKGCSVKYTNTGSGAASGSWTCNGGTKGVSNYYKCVGTDTNCLKNYCNSSASTCPKGPGLPSSISCSC